MFYNGVHNRFILAYDQKKKNFKNDFLYYVCKLIKMELSRSINNTNEYRFCILDNTELKFASLKSARCVRSHFNYRLYPSILELLWSYDKQYNNVSDKHNGYYHSTDSD